MLRFSLFGIPVRIHWLFWLLCAMLGGALGAHGPEQWQHVLLFVGAAFISILAHEFGHALTGRKMGALHVHVELYSFGGLAHFPHAHFTRPQSILVTFAGPAAGFALCLLSLLILKSPLMKGTHSAVPQFFAIMVQINFIWSLLNLLPILPLDGGQIMRDILGPSRRRAASIISLICIAVLIPFAFQANLIFGVIILVMMAFENGKALFSPRF